MESGLCRSHYVHFFSVVGKYENGIQYIHVSLHTNIDVYAYSYDCVGIIFAVINNVVRMSIHKAIVVKFSAYVISCCLSESYAHTFMYPNWKTYH